MSRGWGCWPKSPAPGLSPHLNGLKAPCLAQAPAHPCVKPPHHSPIAASPHRPPPSLPTQPGPSTACLQQLLRRLQPQLHRLPPKALSYVLWAFTRLGCRPGMDFMLLLVQVRGRLGHMCACV